MIIGTYNILYNNGIKQTKNLISHDAYEHIFKPIKNEIFILEEKNKYKPTKESMLLSHALIVLFGNAWFTDKSPLFDAINTGVLSLTQSQGGDISCRITPIMYK